MTKRTGCDCVDQFGANHPWLYADCPCEKRDLAARVLEAEAALSAALAGTPNIPHGPESADHNGAPTH